MNDSAGRDAFARILAAQDDQARRILGAPPSPGATMPADPLAAQSGGGFPPPGGGFSLPESATGSRP